MTSNEQLIHGTLIALGANGALLIGDPGTGKSDLALRFIMNPPNQELIKLPPTLIADDQVTLKEEEGKIYGQAPQNLQGKIEARHVGIMQIPFEKRAEIKLVVELTPANEIERMPVEQQFYPLMQQQIPLIQLAPFEASAVNKLMLALNFL